MHTKSILLSKIGYLQQLHHGCFKFDKSTDYIPHYLLISIKVQKGHTKVNVEFVWAFDVKNTSVEAWISQGSVWTFIRLTMYPDKQTHTARIKVPWGLDREQKWHAKDGLLLSYLHIEIIVLWILGGRVMVKVYNNYTDKDAEHSMLFYRLII